MVQDKSCVGWAARNVDNLRHGRLDSLYLVLDTRPRWQCIQNQKEHRLRYYEVGNFRDNDFEGQISSLVPQQLKESKNSESLHL